MAFRIKNNRPTTITTTVGDEDIQIKGRGVAEGPFAESDATDRLRWQVRNRIVTLLTVPALAVEDDDEVIESEEDE